MSQKVMLRVAAALALLTLLITPLAVSAHETVPAGNYNLEYGWTDEPALVNQPNALVFNIEAKESDSGDAAPAASDSQAPEFSVDVSALKIEVDYGGQSKVLQLQPLADGGPGQYVAPFVPTKAGQYTVKITGKISGSAGDSDVDLAVNPEEVEALDAYAFPAVAAGDSGGSSFGLTGWLALGGLIAGLVGIALSAVALTRKK